MDRVKARVEQLRTEFAAVLSSVDELEATAQARYQREVPRLQDRIRNNEDTIEELQRANEAARDQIVQLRNAVETVQREKVELLAAFGRGRTNNVGLNRGPDRQAGPSGQDPSLSLGSTGAYLRMTTEPCEKCGACHHGSTTGHDRRSKPPRRARAYQSAPPCQRNTSGRTALQEKRRTFPEPGRPMCS